MFSLIRWRLWFPMLPNEQSVRRESKNWRSPEFISEPFIFIEIDTKKKHNRKSSLCTYIFFMHKHVGALGLDNLPYETSSVVMDLLLN